MHRATPLAPGEGWQWPDLDSLSAAPCSGCGGDPEGISREGQRGLARMQTGPCPSGSPALRGKEGVAPVLSLS